MKKYRVTLEKEERESLELITRKGSHRSQRVISALILLNCDEGPLNTRHPRGQDIAEILGTSLRKIDRVKKRFVEEGIEAALGSRQGQRVHECKTDGDFEAHLLALSCSKPPEGFARWSLRLLADRVVDLQYIDSISYETIRRVLKKTKSSRGKKSAG